jgi:hypothetical protein
MSSGYQGNRLTDSHELAAQQRPYVPEGSFEQHTINLIKVLHGSANGLTERRAALTALQKDGHPAVQAIVTEFLKTLSNELSDPAVVSPRSPKHPQGTVTGAID